METEDLSKYTRVYQTWHLLRTNAAAAHAESKPREAEGNGSECGSAAASSAFDLRHRVQMARVERSMSIQELSARIQCEPQTLAAFERGDEVLSEDLQRAVCKALQMDVDRPPKRAKR